MSLVVASSFHVECPFSRLHVCHCSLGNSYLSKSSIHSTATNQLWQQFQTMLAMPVSNRNENKFVEIPVPRLYKYEKHSREALDCVSRKEAQARLKAAEKAATQAVLRAAKAASLAGITYSPPEGVNAAVRESDLKARDTVEGVEGRLQRLRQDAAALDEEVAQLAASRRQLADQAASEMESAMGALAGARKALEGARREAEAAKHRADVLEQQRLLAERQASTAAATGRGADAGAPQLQRSRPRKDAADDSGTESDEWGPPGAEVALLPRPRALSGATRPLRSEVYPDQVAKPPLALPSSPTSLQHPPTKARTPKPNRPRAPPTSPPAHPLPPPLMSPNRPLSLLASISSHPTAPTPRSKPLAPSLPPPRAKPQAVPKPAPRKKRLLTPRDLTPQLEEKVVQLYWPEDSTWWPATVVSVDLHKGLANVVYDTGEEEEDLDIREMVQRGEIAWFDAAELQGAAPLGGLLPAVSVQAAPAPAAVNNKRKSNAPASSQTQQLKRPRSVNMEGPPSILISQPPEALQQGTASSRPAAPKAAKLVAKGA